MSQWNVDELLDDGHLPRAAAHILVANHVLPFNLLQSADTTVDIVAEGVIKLGVWVKPFPCRPPHVGDSPGYRGGRGDQTGGLGRLIPLQTSSLDPVPVCLSLCLL